MPRWPKEEVKKNNKRGRPTKLVSPFSESNPFVCSYCFESFAQYGPEGEKQLWKGERACKRCLKGFIKAENNGASSKLKMSGLYYELPKKEEKVNGFFVGADPVKQPQTPKNIPVKQPTWSDDNISHLSHKVHNLIDKHKELLDQVSNLRESHHHNFSVSRCLEESLGKRVSKLENQKSGSWFSRFFGYK